MLCDRKELAAPGWFNSTKVAALRLSQRLDPGIPRALRKDLHFISILRRVMHQRNKLPSGLLSSNRWAAAQE